jgi:YYY domain-containing protein
MTAFISWYLILTLLGWLTFPLVHYLFPALADRGYTLSRVAGLLIWGYIFWLLASLGIAQNDIGGIFLALSLLIGLSAWSAFGRQRTILDFLKENTSLAITTEILFFAAFAFLAFVRSANPELTSTEKPMELAFINGILRSPVFPPQDPWLSGYAISYYYFGYVMTAMLARLSGITGSMAHNLMTSLVFALGAIGSYGILYNLLSINRGSKTKDRDANNNGAELPVLRPSSSILGLSLLAPLFLLLVSNFGALLEILHQGGLFWTKDPATDQYSSRFWTWLDMKELSLVPAIPFHWLPLDRYLWWWRSSRVLQDYDMLKNPLEVIDEFPFFSFLLGDLHPHVLAIPFSLLAIAVALNLYLGGWRGSINAFGVRLHINLKGFLFSSLVLGGLAFLNTWDILVAAALIVAAYIFRRANEDGWRWDRLEDLFLFGLPLGILSLLLYFPFYLGFSSQAGGILPNLMYPTRGMHLWVMWGTLLIPIFAYVIYLSFGQLGVQKHSPAQSSGTNGTSEPSDSRLNPNWKLGFSLGLGFAIFLFLLALALGWISSFVEKDFVMAFLASQGMTFNKFLSATSLRRLSYIGSLITLLAVFIPSLAFLFAHDQKSETVNQKSSTQFILLVLTLGTILILIPDFVYLRDQFGYRINTVFKFYYQAWMLWSLVAAFGTAYLLQNLRGAVNIIFRIVIGLVIFVGLLYPVLGLLTITNNFKPTYGFTLDDFDRIVRENPDEAAAIKFLRTVPDGVIAEAVGDGYSSYARISEHTGLQTVIGWPGHEAQWRGSYAPQGSRRDDMTKLYTTTRWEEAQQIINQYNIRYIYIGGLEHASMPVNEEKFQAHLKPIFQQGSTVIYEAQ